VVGAAIEMGFCLDLTTSIGIQAVAAMYRDFLDYCSTANVDVPANTGGKDLVFRKLDCAVISHFHEVRETGGLQSFDTVKGVFIEGDRIYQLTA
jgi:hypothetical protein